MAMSDTAHCAASLQADLQALLRGNNVPKEVDARLKECFIVSVEQFAAIRNEDILDHDVSSHVRWWGPPVAHVGQRLWLVVAWKAAQRAVEKAHLTELYSLEADPFISTWTRMSTHTARITPRWLSAIKIQAKFRMVLCRWSFARRVLALHVIQTAARARLLRRRGFVGMRFDSAGAIREPAALNAHILSFPWTLSVTGSTTSRPGIILTALKMFLARGITSLFVQPCALKSEVQASQQAVELGPIVCNPEVHSGADSSSHLTQAIVSADTRTAAPEGTQIIRRSSRIGALRRGEISRSRYARAITASGFIAAGVFELAQVVPAVGPCLLAGKITAGLGSTIHEYMTGRIDGQTLLLDTARQLGMVGLQSSLQFGSVVGAGALAGTVFGPGGAMLGGCLGFLAGFLLARWALEDIVAHHTEEWKERRAQVHKLKEQVRSAYLLLGLDRGCTLSKVQTRYKKLLVEKVSITVYSEDQLLIVKRAMGENLLLKEGISIGDNPKVPNQRLLLGILVGKNTKSVRMLSDLDDVIYNTTGFPCKLIFSGEYVHPDKVPEEFRETQHAKMLALQLAVEMVSFTLLNPDWEQAACPKCPDPEQAQRSEQTETPIQDLMQTIPRRQDTSDLLTTLSSLSDLPPTELQDELLALIRSHARKPMSAGTLIIALRVVLLGR
eukprot:TRINITY_DN10847_c0_g1_i1.p1 TRINITY_DN10847_c0_g1~~TRINITY_DN10847_c0_g1_i1.p1  ORF type:complete len:679 (+),score=82.98 TRINITY_DN10847_c0_g1_i1:30-2039(+)